MAAIAALALVASLVGCGFPDRRAAADAIGATVRAMPGVADADVRYDTSFDGGAHFNLTATLAPTATTDQAAAVARTFVDRMIAADFKSFDVALELRFRGPGLTGDLTDRKTSQFSVRYGFHNDVRADPSAQAVAEEASLWLDIARSPNIDGVLASLPLEDASSAMGPNLHVGLPVAADDAALTELIRVHPQLHSARWVVSVPTPSAPGQLNTYESVGQLPDRRTRETWQRIPEQFTRSDSASATTRVSTGKTPTEVTLQMGYDSGRAGDFERITRGVAALLSGLPLPALLQVHARVETPGTGEVVDRDLAVTVGGCTGSDPKFQHPAEPVEGELRQQYERC